MTSSKCKDQIVDTLVHHENEVYFSLQYIKFTEASQLRDGNFQAPDRSGEGRQERNLWKLFGDLNGSRTRVTDVRAWEIAPYPAISNPFWTPFNPFDG